MKTVRISLLCIILLIMAASVANNNEIYAMNTEASISPGTVYNENDISIVFAGMGYLANSSQAVLNFSIYNKGTNDYNVHIPYISINGYSYEIWYYEIVTAGNTLFGKCTIDQYQLDVLGTDTIQEIGVRFKLEDSRSGDEKIDTGLITIETTLSDSGSQEDLLKSTIYDNAKIRISNLGPGTYNGAPCLWLCAGNDSGEDISLYEESMSVDGVMVSGTSYCNIMNGERSIFAIYTTDVESLVDKEIQFSFTIAKYDYISTADPSTGTIKVHTGWKSNFGSDVSDLPSGVYLASSIIENGQECLTEGRVAYLYEDGTYLFKLGIIEKKGTWELNGEKIVFNEKGGDELIGRLSDKTLSVSISEADYEFKKSREVEKNQTAGPIEKETEEIKDADEKVASFSIDGFMSVPWGTTANEIKEILEGNDLEEGTDFEVWEADENTDMIAFYDGNLYDEKLEGYYFINKKKGLNSGLYSFKNTGNNVFSIIEKGYIDNFGEPQISDEADGWKYDLWVDEAQNCLFHVIDNEDAIASLFGQKESSYAQEFVSGMVAGSNKEEEVKHLLGLE